MEKGRTLARDDDGWYGIYESDPKKRYGDWSDAQPVDGRFSESDFHILFGCHPVRKGRKKRIKRILIELED